MLAYILALAVATGSIGIYIAAFFFPEIGRKNDIYWSGVGLFYALVLWVCAKQITGGLLLGQVAGVVLLGWFAFQTLQLRRQLTPQQQQTAVPSAAQVTSNIQERVAKRSPLQKLSQFGKKASSSATATKQQPQTKSAEKVSAPAEATPTVEIVDNRTFAATETTESVSTSGEKIAPEIEVIPPAESTDAVEAEVQLNSEVVAATPSETQQPEGSATTETETKTETELSSDSETTELHRPDPPSPELVEAALEDAEEKHQSAAPPESKE